MDRKTSRFPPRYIGSYMYDGIREPCMKTPQEAGESSVICAVGSIMCRNCDIVAFSDID